MISFMGSLVKNKGKGQGIIYHLNVDKKIFHAELSICLKCW